MVRPLPPSPLACSMLALRIGTGVACSGIASPTKMSDSPLSPMSCSSQYMLSDTDWHLADTALQDGAAQTSLTLHETLTS